jgi:Fe-S cluster assembly protein SufB
LLPERTTAQIPFDATRFLLTRFLAATHTQQLFYLQSRGLPEDEAMAMIVRGFIEPIAKELPMEYALELNKLIQMQMEGAVG